MPTLHDVAREANVSLATASRVLNGSTRKVADTYRERVEEAAKKLGYVPNLNAQSVARGTTPVVALLVPDIGDEYFCFFVQGVADAADAEGLVVTIAVTDHNREREMRIVNALRGQRPRGLIMAAPHADGVYDELQEILERVAADGTRIISFHDELRSAEAVLRIDNFGAGRLLGEKMAEIGYRRAIVITGPEGMAAADDRANGFRGGFTTAGGEVIDTYTGWFSRELGYDAMQRALAKGLEPGTLVACMTDIIALGAASAIREAGRSVGADIALSGFDDMPQSRDMVPQITSMHIPLLEIGRQAFRAVTDESWTQEPTPMRVIVRDSTPYLV